MKKIKNILNRIGKDIREYGPAGAVFIVYYLVVHYFNETFCPLLAVTGVPCAGCGLTRAGLCLLSGQFQRAAFLNPSIFPVLLFLLYCGYYRYIRGSRIKGFNFAFILLIVCVLAIYAYGMYRYFPGRVPYVYQRNNLMARRIPAYGEWMDGLVAKLRTFRVS